MRSLATGRNSVRNRLCQGGHPVIGGVAGAARLLQFRLLGRAWILAVTLVCGYPMKVEFTMDADQVLDGDGIGQALMARDCLEIVTRAAFHCSGD